MNDMKNSEIAITLGVGMLVGAGVALLLAPRSGQKTRQHLEAFARDTLDEGRRRIDEAQEHLEDQADRVRSALHEGREAFVREVAKS